MKQFTIEQYITQYPIGGNNVVSKPKYEGGKVYINYTQYFDQVSEVTYNFLLEALQASPKMVERL